MRSDVAHALPVLPDEGGDVADPPRRITQVLLDEIAAIESTSDPVDAVWDLL